MKRFTSGAAIFMGAIIVAIATAYYISADDTQGGSKTYMTDRTGERWDITQAVSLGFKPGGFQYGIGRHAIPPLDGASLKQNAGSLPDHQRVIGVENGSDAHAYVVRKLVRHEIANTDLGDLPIAAAY